MKQSKSIFVIIVFVLFIFSCKENNVKPTEIEPLIEDGSIITFNKDIKPMFIIKCSPCHAAGGDRVNKYVEYNTSKTLITGIIGRITKDVSDPLFMPKNGTKLNKTEMDLVNQWIKDGLLEK
jgi:hypothetical protein